MSKKSITEAWQEREALRHELAGARSEIMTASRSLKHSVNPKERARDFIREKPLAATLGTLVAGAVAIKVLPSLLWKSKGNLFSRFTGELMRGAAGMVLPLIASKVAAAVQRRQEPEDPLIRHRDEYPVP